MTVKCFFCKSIILLAALLNLALRNIDNIDEYGLLLIAILLLEVPVLHRVTSEHVALQLEM